jgi:hypothetical protein
MSRHLPLLFCKQMNIGQHEPVIEMNLGGDAIALAFPNPVHRVLEICGVSLATARDVFIEVEGLNTIEAFGALSGDADVTEMAKRMASRTANAGRVILGTMQIKRIQALVFWVKDHERRQMDIEPNAWNEEELRATLARKEADQNFEKLDIDIVDPGKCQTDFGWDAWQIAFTNKLSASMGAAKVPLAYVIRNDIAGDYEYEDDEEVRMYQMPLTGENFKRDNKLVYAMLKSACVKTDAWTWIQDHDKSANGRGAWMSLIGHYDGTGELNKRLERSKEEISRLHYKDEKSFPFNRYVTKLKENFFILSKDKDEELTGKQKVDIMMKGIKSTDASIIAAKTDVYKDYRSDFSAATNFLSGLISNTHSAAQLDYSNRTAGNSRKRYISAVDSRDQRGGRGRFRRGGRSGERGGRDNGRGRGRNSRSRVQINGIDVSDPTRNFTTDEWERLGAARSYVTQQRSIANGRNSGGRNAGRGNNTNTNNQRNTSAANTTTNNDTTTGTVASDTQSQSNTTISERGSQNGRSFGRGAY